MIEKISIAIVCEYFYPDCSGGTPTDLSELASYLKEHHAEIEIDVITSSNLYRPSVGRTILAPRELWKGVHIRRLRTPRSNRPSMFFRLLAGGMFSLMVLGSLLSRPAYDLILIVTNPPANALAAWLYSKLRRVPYVYLVHDLYPDIASAMGRLRETALVARVFKRMQTQWLTSAARIVVLGRCMRDHLHGRYHVSPDCIRVISSWADPNAVIVSTRNNEFRRANGLVGFIVVYAGNFSHYVNFDQILEAARLLEDDDITFVLVGGGVRRNELMETVAREARKNVRVLPMVPRAAMNEVLAAADISLISLDRRMLGLGVPSKLYSILASARPVVALVPSGSEVAKVLEEEHSGVYVSSGDPLLLAREIKRLKIDRGLAELMGQNARSAFERRFTVHHSGEQFYSLLTEVLAER